MAEVGWRRREARSVVGEVSRDSQVCLWAMADDMDFIPSAVGIYAKE